MRIISGSLGGRRLNSPKNDLVRPTSDKVRGALFNTLLTYTNFIDCRVLDLFTGTGALGLESYSRGAPDITLVDTHPKLAEQNVKDLGVQAHVLRMRAEKFNPTMPYDIIFMDPPYRQGYVEKILKNKDTLGHEDTLWIIETEEELEFMNLGFEVLKDKAYGTQRIRILRQL